MRRNTWGDAERAANLLKTLKEAAGAVGKLTDFSDAIDDFKGNDPGLKVSDALKRVPRSPERESRTYGK